MREEPEASAGREKVSCSKPGAGNSTLLGKVSMGFVVLKQRGQGGMARGWGSRRGTASTRTWSGIMRSTNRGRSTNCMDRFLISHDWGLRNVVHGRGGGNMVLEDLICTED